MKAVNKKTGNEYEVEMSGQGNVSLKCLESNQVRRVEYSTFKREFNLVDQEVEVNRATESVEQELKTVDQLVDDILGSCNEPDTVITLDFSEKPKTNPRKKSEKKVESSGLTTLKDICEELGVNPTKARRVLRKTIGKPESGKWEFDETNAEKVKSLLR